MLGQFQPHISWSASAVQMGCPDHRVLQSLLGSLSTLLSCPAENRDWRQKSAKGLGRQAQTPWCIISGGEAVPQWSGAEWLASTCGRGIPVSDTTRLECPSAAGFSWASIQVAFFLPAQISLWDTAGEERFLSLNSCYFRDASAVLLMYSLSGPLSFDSLSHWLHVARQYCADGRQVGRGEGQGGVGGGAPPVPLAATHFTGTPPAGTFCTDAFMLGKDPSVKARGSQPGGS